MPPRLHCWAALLLGLLCVAGITIGALIPHAPLALSAATISILNLFLWHHFYPDHHVSDNLFPSRRPPSDPTP